MKTLFEMPSAPRAKRRVLMHVIDAGDCGACRGNECDCVFYCRRCGHTSDWTRVANTSEGKRGQPCPFCNSASETR